MPVVKRKRRIDAPRDEVWRVVSDPYSLPRWWPGVQRVEEASAEAWTNVLTTPKGRTVRADYSRVSADPPKRLVWRQEVDESPFEGILSEAVTELVLEPAGAGSTEVELRATERLRGLSRFGGFMVRRATRQRLDEALERLDLAAAGSGGAS